jgi:divalent metal cation (Fe/Co/Zn/Cd) transporter
VSFFVAIAIGVVQTVTAIVGSYVASKKFTYKQKRPFLWVFIGLAAVGLGLTFWQAAFTKRSAEERTKRYW